MLPGTAAASLPPTAPAASAVSSSPPAVSVFVDGPPGKHEPSPSAPALAPALTSAAPARPYVHARRLTLSRLPLLRKGSFPSIHRASSNTTSTSTYTPPHADPALLAAGAPRASTSTRAPSTHSREAEKPEEPEESTPGKMHQTSSRLLRMTDDERPFTRVGRFRNPTKTLTRHCVRLVRRPKSRNRMPRGPPGTAPFFRPTGFCISRRKRSRRKDTITWSRVIDAYHHYHLEGPGHLRYLVAIATGFLYLDFLFSAFCFLLSAFCLDFCAWSLDPRIKDVPICCFC